jgi:hypothetical protein
MHSSVHNGSSDITSIDAITVRPQLHVPLNFGSWNPESWPQARRLGMELGCICNTILLQQDYGKLYIANPKLPHDNDDYNARSKRDKHLMEVDCPW